MLSAMDKHPDPGEKTVKFSVDTSGFTEGLWKVRAAVLFNWNPELVELDDELDVLYRGQL